ncbi:MAG: diguanylate cyclase [Spirochaetia bacterium]|nr:diguanylate cyclase [Spirochaetia bacterium]
MLENILLNQLTNCIKSGIVILNSKKKILFWNQWIENTAGITSKNALGKNIFLLFPNLKGSRLEYAIENSLTLKQSGFISHTINSNMLPLLEKNLRTGEEKKIIHNIRIYPLKNEMDKVIVFLHITDETSYVEKENILKQKAEDEKRLNLKLMQEITERLNIEKKLRLSASIIEKTTEGVLITDKNAIIEFVNPAFTEITGFTNLEAIGRKVSILKSGKHKSEYYDKMWQCLNNNKSWRGEFINKKPQGSLYVVESSIFTILNDSNEITHYVNIFHDITLRKEHEEKLKKLSITDSLTGLNNRRYFLDTFERIYNSCFRNKEYLSLAFLDVDFFKLYNDTYGHQKGDLCLKKIAEVIEKMIKRPDDVKARYGGEEFVVIMPYTDSKGSKRIMEEIRKEILNLKIPHEKSKVEKYVSISIGVVTIVPGPETLKKDLLNKADEAMYKAKKEGRNRVVSI